MIDLAIISGTGFYEFTGLEEGESLSENSDKSKSVLLSVIKGVIKNFKAPKYKGFIFRFE